MTLRTLWLAGVVTMLVAFAAQADPEQTEDYILKYSDSSGNHENSIMYEDDTNDEIGIGINPSHTLHVNGTGRIVGDLTIDTNGALVLNTGAYVKDGLGYTRVAINDTNRTAFARRYGVEVLSIATDGNVGILDTTPSYKLDVNGDGHFVVADGETALIIGGDLILSGADPVIQNSDGVDQIRLYPSGRTEFYAPRTEEEMLTVTGSSRVGIKNSNPGFVLDVNGRFGVVDTLYVSEDYYGTDIFFSEGAAYGVVYADEYATSGKEAEYPSSVDIAYAAMFSLERLPDDEYDPQDESRQIDYSQLHPYSGPHRSAGDRNRAG